MWLASRHYAWRQRPGLSRAWALLEALGEWLAGGKWEAEKLCLGLPLRLAGIKRTRMMARYSTGPIRA